MKEWSPGEELSEFVCWNLYDNDTIHAHIRASARTQTSDIRVTNSVFLAAVLDDHDNDYDNDNGNSNQWHYNDDDDDYNCDGSGDSSGSSSHGGKYIRTQLQVRAPPYFPIRRILYVIIYFILLMALTIMYMITMELYRLI